MAVPTTATPGSNSAQAGAGVINMPLTAPVVGARAFVIVAHRDNAAGTPTPSAATGFGTWEQVSGSPVVEGTARLTVWTAIVESTAPTQITISDSGDHQQIRVFYVSHANGTPDIHATLASTDAVSDGVEMFHVRLLLSMTVLYISLPQVIRQTQTLQRNILLRLMLA